MLVRLIHSVLGPELYRIYKQGVEPGRDYKPNNLEFYSSTVISFFRGLYVFCKWTSPAIMAFAYYRGYFTYEGLESVSFMAYFFGIIFISTFVARGFSRCSNADYKSFIEKFSQMNKSTTNSSDRKAFLLQYDFEMSYWKPDFIAVNQPPKFKNIPQKLLHDSILNTIKFFTWRFLSKLCVQSFGLRMAYPGIILGNLINKPHLVENRTKFIEQKRAKRVLIQTNGDYKNKIDALFVDQRNKIRYSEAKSNFATLDSKHTSNDSNGNYLVICCDGNASFYEVGIFQIPIERGFSTLGWNYPGFAQSTGLPYPEQLTAAADAVMHYAFDLGFKVENIILFSWSIGGFAVSWLSNQYPDVKGVVLDAPFDDITPLAQQQMPKFATNFVAYTIKHNLNLNVTNLIGNYSGPVQFIRRTQDEIISTIPRLASANRGNELLISTLRKRYPHIITDDTTPYIRTWLSAKSDTDRDRIFNSYTSDLPDCEHALVEHLKHTSWSKNFPLNIGDEKNDHTGKKLSKDLKLTLALYLAGKYLVNFESSHCTPLPKEYFDIPWSESELLNKFKY